MPDHGFLAICLRPECEWVALDARGEPATDTQLGALSRIDAHCHADHGEPVRTARRACACDPRTGLFDHPTALGGRCSGLAA